MRKCWQFLRERGAVKAIAGIVALLGTCAVAAGLVLLLASVAYAADDSNTIYPLDALNPTSGTFGSVTYPGELFAALSSEDAGRQYEQGFPNCVSVEASAQSCQAGTSAGLTMTPGSCIAYNQMWRSTETGSVTFPNSSTCWLGMDENTTGSNPGLTNFTRVTATHYLIDCIDATQPIMAADSQLLLKVKTSGGAITVVKDLRNICALGTCGGGTLNGIVNVMDFGAHGDTVTGTDGTVSTNYNFTSASLNCTAARVGETIHVVAAGSAAGLLQTTVASCSGNTFVMAVAAAETISGTASWAIGHDDTNSIQAAQSASYVTSSYTSATNALYFPAGKYLVTAPLNFTDVANAHVYGAGQDMSTIFCSSSGQSVCVDASGGNYNQWDHLTILSGVSTQDAPTVNFLKARVGGNNVAIGDTYDHVAFKAYSPWNFYGFYNEQATWHDSYFEVDGTSTVNLTLSNYNTAGITSPFITFTTESSAFAATIFSINGADTAFQTMHAGGAGKPHILIDGTFQGISLKDFFFGDGNGASAGMSLLGDGGVVSNLDNLNITGVVGNMDSTTELIVSMAKSDVGHVDIDGRNDPSITTSAIWQFQFHTIKHSRIAFQANEPRLIQATYCPGTDLPGATGSAQVSCPYANFIAGNANSVRTYLPAYVTSQIDGLFVYGGITLSVIPDPLAPTVTSFCTVAGSEHCNSSCTYYVQYQDITNDFTGVSPATTITNCPNTPSSTNYVTILPQLTGSEFWVGVMKGTASNLLGHYFPSDYALNPGGYGNDIGQAPENAFYTPPAATTGSLHLESGHGIACSGSQALATGAATVANGCITGRRPIFCTDNSATAPEAVTCSNIRPGAFNMYGNSSDTIGWVQL